MVCSIAISHFRTDIHTKTIRSENIQVSHEFSIESGLVKVPGFLMSWFIGHNPYHPHIIPGHKSPTTNNQGNGFFPKKSNPPFPPNLSI